MSSKKMNLEKLSKLEKEISEAKSSGGEAKAPKVAEVLEKKPEVKKEVKPEEKKGGSHLKVLEDAFKKGMISKKSYEKVKKMFLGE